MPKCGLGRGGILGRTMLTEQEVIACPLSSWRGPTGTEDGVYVREATVNRELACPATPQPIYVAACQDFCLEGAIDSDVYGLLDGSGDALGLPIYYGEAIQLKGMPCSMEMVKDGREP